MYYYKKYRGFTIIEIAIVLAVIGLISGGIITAYSVISSATVTSTIRSYNDTLKSSQIFKTMYNHHPGDLTRMTIKTNSGERISLYKNNDYAGNGDGYVQFGCAKGSGCKNIEAYQFYPQLTRTGLFTTESSPSESYPNNGSGCHAIEGYSHLTNIKNGQNPVFLTPVPIYKSNTFETYQAPYQAIKGQYLFLFESEANGDNGFPGFNKLAKNGKNFSTKRDVPFFTRSCGGNNMAKIATGEDNYLPPEILIGIDEKIDGTKSPNSGYFVAMKRTKSKVFIVSDMASDYGIEEAFQGIGAFKMW